MKPRIVLVGPSSQRYKGGIAQFTSNLALHLEQSAEVTFVSWTKLYPAFLSTRVFGESVSKFVSGHRSALYLLSYTNPFTWIRFIALLRRLDPDKVLLTWSHPVHAPIYLILNFLTKLVCKTELVYLCHNVMPHESFPGAQLISRLCFKGADRLVVHGSNEKRELGEFCPGANIQRLFLTVFRLDGDGDLETPEEELETDTRLLFYGIIRHYKGLDILLRAMPLVLKKHPSAKLKIAGEFFDDKAKANSPLALIEELGLEHCVDAQIGYVANEDVPQLFREADLAVFPYRSATQSGAITTSYAYSTPVVATNVGSIADIVSEGESGLLCDSAEPELIADAINRFFNHPVPAKTVREFAKKLSWEKYVKYLVDGGRDFEI